MADTSQYTDSAQPEKPEHPPLTAERVRAVLKYDAESGDFSWLSGRGMSSPGRPAGSVNGRGYVAIQVDGRCYLAHRLAWLHVHSAWPSGVIDHVNGKTEDNRLENLRDTSLSENLRNRKNVKGMSRKGRSWRVWAAGNYAGSSVCFGRAAKIRKAAYENLGYGPQSFSTWKPIGDLARRLVEEAVGRE